MGIKVKATARGFYGQLREKGEEFEVADKTALGTWMEPIGKTAKAEDGKTDKGENA